MLTNEIKSLKQSLASFLDKLNKETLRKAQMNLELQQKREQLKALNSIVANNARTIATLAAENAMTIAKISEENSKTVAKLTEENRLLLNQVKENLAKKEKSPSLVSRAFYLACVSLPQGVIFGCCCPCLRICRRAKSKQ